METWTLLAVMIAIVIVGYAVVNVVFRLASDAVTFVENNRVGVLIILVILIALLFGWRS